MRQRHARFPVAPVNVPLTRAGLWWAMGNCCGGADASTGVVTNTNVKPPRVVSVKFCVAGPDGKMGPTVTTFDPNTKTFNLIGSISHKCAHVLWLFARRCGRVFVCFCVCLCVRECLFACVCLCL